MVIEMKSFTKLLTGAIPVATVTSQYEPERLVESSQKNGQSSAEDALRSVGLKIKLITPTAFGVQFDMARKYEDAIIADALVGFDYDTKGNMIFVKF